MEKIKFAPEVEELIDDEEPWIVLIADDEGTVHLVTEMVLKDFKFQNRSVKLLSAFSGEQTIDRLKEEPKIAVILLDVVMENITAGLDAVTAIRNSLKNHEVRIILRTGQAGINTISDIIRQYDINGYEKKEYLTHRKLQDTIILALRAYRDIQQAKEKENEKDSFYTN